MRTADFGPGMTPSPVKWLMMIAGIVSIGSGVMQGILSHLNIFPGPQEILSLSWWGFSAGYIWQVLTYAFVQDMPANDVTFSFFSSLLITLYIMWIMGSALNSTVGDWSYCKFIAVCVALTGALTVVLIRLLGHFDMLTGLPVLALINTTVWAIRFPTTSIFLFLLIPINSLSLAMTICAAYILFALFAGEFANAVLYTISIAVAYLYALLVWEWRGPFAFLEATENWLFDWRAKLTHNHPAMREKDNRGGTIIDIDTGKPTLEDDAFVDAMLAKISQHGEDSLTWRERERLEVIAKRKKR